MASGKVMIFMGDGYGKSAASLGIAMKRASEGDSIVIIQFLKGKIHRIDQMFHTFTSLYTYL